MTQEDKDFAPCWNCGKLNKKQEDGYYMCNCRKYKESSVLWYLPEKVERQQKLEVEVKQ
jgi:hypothetical protein